MHIVDQFPHRLTFIDTEKYDSLVVTSKGHFEGGIFLTIFLQGAEEISLMKSIEYYIIAIGKILAITPERLMQWLFNY